MWEADEAEDGIRDGTVTGVQTCALPISGRRAHGERAVGAPRAPGGLLRRRMGVLFREARHHRREGDGGRSARGGRGGRRQHPEAYPGICKSEERRVGKEGRCGRQTKQKTAYEMEL